MVKIVKTKLFNLRITEEMYEQAVEHLANRVKKHGFSPISVSELIRRSLQKELDTGMHLKDELAELNQGLDVMEESFDRLDEIEKTIEELEETQREIEELKERYYTLMELKTAIDTGRPLPSLPKQKQ